MDVYINGIGIISRCACRSEELEEAAFGRIAEIRPLPLEFPIEIPSSRLRRNSRYNKLACAAADQALKNAGIPEMMEQEGLDGHRIGTILSTGYGAAEYSSVFADSVVKLLCWADLYHKPAERFQYDIGRGRPAGICVSADQDRPLRSYTGRIC